MDYFSFIIIIFIFFLVNVGSALHPLRVSVEHGEKVTATHLQTALHYYSNNQSRKNYLTLDHPFRSYEKQGRTGGEKEILCEWQVRVECTGIQREPTCFFSSFSPLLLDTLIMEMCAGLSSQGATLLDQRGNTYAKNTTFHLLPLLFK